MKHTIELSVYHQDNLLAVVPLTLSTDTTAASGIDSPSADASKSVESPSPQQPNAISLRMDLIVDESQLGAISARPHTFALVLGGSLTLTENRGTTTYDATGRLRSITDPLGRRTTYVYSFDEELIEPPDQSDSDPPPDEPHVSE